MKIIRCLLALLALATTVCAQTVYTTDTGFSTDTTLGQALVVTNAATLSITNNATLSTGAGNNAVIGGMNPGGGSTDGNLTITSGTFSANAAFLGQFNGSRGTATLTGSDSSWTNASTLAVGSLGTGAITASAGATLTSSNGVLGGNAGTTGTVTLTGSGTDWTTALGVHVGENGTGTLTLADGASMHNGAIKLGNFSGSTGTAIVSGSGTNWTNTELNVGYTGIGTLTLSTGAMITVNAGTGVATLGTSGGTGTLNIGAAATDSAAAAGVLNAASVTTGTGTGVVQFNTTGTTYFTEDGTSTGPGITTSGSLSLVHTAGTTVFTGTLGHTGLTTLNGGIVLFEGSVTSSLVTVNDGATVGGSATFGSGLTLNEGAQLEFSLGETTGHDVMAVTGGTLTGPTTGTITLHLFDSGDFAAGTYDLLQYTDLAPGTLTADSFYVGTAIAGYDYDFIDTGSSFQLVATFSAIPEPSTYAALAGLAALAFAVRRRRK